MFLPHPRVKVSIVGSLRDREVACSASDRQGSNFESCVWRTVSSQSSHHPQEVLLAQFSLYVHKGGLNFICILALCLKSGFCTGYQFAYGMQSAIFEKQLTSILSNLNNFHSLEVVDRVSKTQLQVGENSDWITDIMFLKSFTIKILV